MCTAMFQSLGQQNLPEGLKGPQSVGDRVPADASDVPLGEGLAESAKTSILSRRERIAKALEDAGA